MPNRHVLLLLAIALSGVHVVRAQCQPQWLAGDPFPTPVGEVVASVLWDPDAGGPLPQVLVVAGALHAAWSTGVTVATFDGTTWSTLGTSPGFVRALAVHNGQLHTARELTGITYIEVWAGTSWQQLGAATGVVNALTVHASQLVIGGDFTAVNGISATDVARWTGTAWAPFGGGLNGVVLALASFNGALYAGGALGVVGGTTTNLASWNG